MRMARWGVSEEIELIVEEEMCKSRKLAPPLSIIRWLLASSLFDFSSFTELDGMGRDAF